MTDAEILAQLTSEEKLKVANARRIEASTKGKPKSASQLKMVAEGNAIIERVTGKGDATQWVTASVLAEWLNCDQHEISRFRKDERVIGKGEGRSTLYDLKGSVRAFCSIGRKYKSAGMKMSVAELTEEKLRNEVEKLKLENEKTKGKLVPFSLAVQIVNKAFAPVKTLLEALPKRGYSINPADPIQAEKVLNEEVKRILSAMQASIKQVKIDEPDSETTD